MTEIPPSRWRVVERDRRLVVIDTRADPAPTRPSATPAVPRKIAFDGTREWTTRGFYDAGGPRLVRLSNAEARQAMLAGATVLTAIVALMALAGIGAIAIVVALGALAAQHGKPWLTRRLDAMAMDR